METLCRVAFLKNLLPLRLRGWVNELGVYTRLRKAGKWSRLQAGGQFRSYLDAWQHEESEWEVKRFDKQTWERRFTHLVKPTFEIAEFLNSAGEAEGGLNNKNAVILKQAIEHYKSTREWLILPRNARGNKGLLWRDDQEKEELNTEISDFEKMTQSDPDDPTPWSILAIKYELLGKYKDVERALKVASELQIAKHPDLETADWEAQLRLGKLYFAALSNAIRGKGIPIWGHSPSRVTPESLGYTIEQVRSLAEVHLKKTDEVARSSGLNGVINLSLWLQTKLVRLAIEATTTLCESAFNEYDEYSIEEANQT